MSTLHEVHARKGGCALPAAPTCRMFAVCAMVTTTGWVFGEVAEPRRQREGVGGSFRAMTREPRALLAELAGERGVVGRLKPRRNLCVNLRHQNRKNRPHRRYRPGSYEPILQMADKVSSSIAEAGSWWSRLQLSATESYAYYPESPPKPSSAESAIARTFNVDNL
ncbi:hypothetical protein FIBSPDRAFT_901879 [Athelia psychrophila]|uniref:Uncharacterized protein n=1 Tax=Athelia psychrophila TaxID=1759441 RepID=A0A165WJN1_9AGAM|nr:hypothetical protein FIBSPDRAFT_901879 [Fibularhizoctonia sp. CBS 109695]